MGKYILPQMLVVGVILPVVFVNSAILKLGNPLSWSVSKPHINFIWNQGIQQFISHYTRSQGLESPTFLWGDEIEYGIFKCDATKHYDISLRSPEIRNFLSQYEIDHSELSEGCVWQPEFGNWMVEAIPKDPYSGYVSDLLKVEKTMQLRRKRLHAALNDDEIAPSITTFPMLGVDGYAHTINRLGPYANSKYVSDDVINPHPRFTTLTQNIRSRRGSNVNIIVEKDSDLRGNSSVNQSSVHMDAMPFGMGCCCVQVTMQCRDEFESRILADQLAILSPIFLALSASSPIFKGHLVDTDTRWNVISQSVDDRTPAERGEISGTAAAAAAQPELVGQGITPLSKSRYSSVSLFIGQTQGDEDRAALQRLNDVEATADPKALSALLEGGIDPVLAAHVAHLFSRDPLVIFDDTVPPAVDAELLQSGLDHFESIQSTNWRTVRWKPPIAAPPVSLDPPKSAATLKRAVGPGWRVEFRPMEVQLTDFENAALSILVVLASRCMLALGHSFYMPMSLVEENMQRSQNKNAILEEKFFVRTQSFRPVRDNIRCSRTRPLIGAEEDMSVEEMTINEFINGKTGFLGLVPAILQYLDALGCDLLTRGRLLPYLTLLQKRAAGELPTTAQWVRSFVASHPRQQQHWESIGAHGDRSAVCQETVDDLLRACDDIGMGRRQCADLVGDVLIQPLAPASPEGPLGERTLDSPLYGTAVSTPTSTSVSCDGGDLVKPVHLDAALSSSYCGEG